MKTRVQRPAGTWVPLLQPRHFRELRLSQCKVPWGWGIWITNICQREWRPPKIIHTQVSRLKSPSSTPNQGLWTRYTEKWFQKQMFRTFIMQLMSKSSFQKSNMKIFLNWFIYFPVLFLHHSVITFFPHESSPRPREELRPLGAPTTVPPPPRPVNRRTAALFTDMEKFLCQKKKRKEKKWIKQMKPHVVPHHLPQHLQTGI